MELSKCLRCQTFLSPFREKCTPPSPPIPPQSHPIPIHLFPPPFPPTPFRPPSGGSGRSGKLLNLPKIENYRPVLILLVHESAVLEPLNHGRLALNPGVSDGTNLLAVEVLPRHGVVLVVERHNVGGVHKIDESVTAVALVLKVDWEVEEVNLVPVSALPDLVEEHLLSVLVGDVSDHETGAGVYALHNTLQVKDESRVIPLAPSVVARPSLLFSPPSLTVATRISPPSTTLGHHVRLVLVMLAVEKGLVTVRCRPVGGGPVAVGVALDHDEVSIVSHCNLMGRSLHVLVMAGVHVVSLHV